MRVLAVVQVALVLSSLFAPMPVFATDVAVPDFAGQTGSAYENTLATAGLGAAYDATANDPGAAVTSVAPAVGSQVTTGSTVTISTSAPATPSPTPDLTPAPTPDPTPDPTAAPTDTPAPTAEPTASPTDTPAPAPTDTPAPAPTDTPAPAPVPGPPAITSDQPDYAPGETVTLIGTGWQPGESVHIFVNDNEFQTWSRNVDVVADSVGGFVDEFALPTWFVATYTVTATGQQSGVATTSFTDSIGGGTGSSDRSTATTSASPGSTSITISRPSNAAGGDFLLVAVTVRDLAANNICAPSGGGWTSLRRDESTSSGTYLTQEVFWKFAATGSSDSSTVFTFRTGGCPSSGSTIQMVATAVIIRYTGVNTATPVDIHNATTGSGTTLTAPAVTTNFNDERLVRLYGSRTGTGMTNVAFETSPNNVGTAAEDSTQASAGLSSTDTASDSTSALWVAQTVALKPAPSVTLSLTGSPMAESAGVATVTATLSAVAATDVAVTLGYTGTATGGGTDYSASSTSITITAGNLTGSATLTAVQDTLDESNETIVVDINAVSGGGGAIESGTQQVTATITDDDPTPTVTLSLTGDPIAEAAGVATLTANLSAVSGQTVTVTLGFGGTATPPSSGDYTRSPSGTTITIPAGNASGSMTLTAVQDTLDETDETIVVDITGVTNGTESGTQQATATITDDDPIPTVAFSATTSSALETTTAVTVPVTLSTASGQTVTVHYSVTGGGTATGGGVDYTLAAGTLTFVPGDSSESISITVVNDAIDEPDETIEITLDSPTNAALGVNTVHTRTILDNDNPPSLGFVVASSNASEASTPALLSVTLGGASGFTVTVDYSVTGGTATGGGVDYTLASGTLTFVPGDTSEAVSIDVVDDLLDEPNETVIVTLSNAVNGNLGQGGRPIVHTYTINDNDPAPTVTLSLTDSPLAENAGVATVTATLDAVSGQNVTVNLGFTGTATNAVDYNRSAVSIVILAGSTSGFITLTGLDDALDEFDETVVVDISSVTNGTESGTQQVTATITDDDPEPTVDFVLTSSSGAEGTTPANLAVSLSAASGRTVTVPWSVTAGSATSPADFTPTAGTLTFNPGVTSQNVALTIVNDSVNETDETIEVTLGTPTNAELGTNTVHTYTILDNDPFVTLSLTGSPIAEAAGSATVTATLSAASPDTTTVVLGFSGTASNPADYTRSGTQIVILAGDTTGSITLSAVQDALDEDDETVVVDISSVTNGIEDGTQQVTAAITDDDPLPTVQFSAASSSAGEATTTVNVPVSLTPVSGRTVTVNYAVDSVAPGTATGAGTDYTLVAGTLTFPAGTTTQNITFTVVNDTLDEPDETIVVTLDTPVNATIGTNVSHTYTIIDNDHLVTLSLSGSPMAEASGVATVTASIAFPSALAVTVNLAFSGTAINGTDYAPSGTQIVIPAGSTSGSITLTATNDTTDENDETVIVDISSVNNGIESGTQQVTATITDDDPPPSVAFTLATSSGIESTTPALLQVSLSAVSGKIVTVHYAATSGTATGSGTDYTLAAGTLTFTAGVTTQNVSIAIVNDTANEANETIVVTLDTPGNATLGAATHTYTIIDNDNTLSGHVFNDLDANGGVSEGDADAPGITVFLDNGTGAHTGNGVLDTEEIRTTTTSLGDFTLTGLVSTGVTYNLRYVVTSGWINTGSALNPDPTTSACGGAYANLQAQVVTLTPGVAGGGVYDLSNPTSPSYKFCTVQSNATVTGTVFDDNVVPDGTKQGGEGGIDGVVVFNDQNKNGVRDAGEAFTTTAGSGGGSGQNYSLGGLIANHPNYIIEEAPPDYVCTDLLPPPVSENGCGTVVEIAAGATVTRNFAFVASHFMYGYVYNDLNGNGIKDSGESGLGGATVKLYNVVFVGGVPTKGTQVGCPSSCATVVTNGSGKSAGRWLFGDLGAGNYIVEETDPAGYISTGSDPGVGSSGTTSTSVLGNLNQFFVVLTASGSLSNANFLDVQGSTISGLVIDDQNGDGASNGGKNGIDYVIGSGRIDLYLDNGNGTFGAGDAIIASVNPVPGDTVPPGNAGEGVWSFGSLLPGTYFVVQTAPTGFGPTEVLPPNHCSGCTSTKDNISTAAHTSRLRVEILQGGVTASGNQFLDQAGDLTLTKSDGVSSVVAGTSTTYDITERNVGTGIASSGAVVADAIPFGTTGTPAGPNAANCSVFATTNNLPWSSSTGYHNNDAVTYVGQTYLALNQGSPASGHQPDISPSFWVLLSTDGLFHNAFKCTTPASLAGASTPGGLDGGTITFQLTLAVASGYILDRGASLTNTVRVTADFDENTTNNTAADTDSVIGQSELSLTKSDGVSSVVAGTSTTYTITVTNSGPSDDPAGIVVSDTIPAGTSYVSSSAGCVPSGLPVTLVTCTTAARLNAGGSTIFTVTLLVAADFQSNSGTFDNTASITSDPNTIDGDAADDTNAADNTATDTDAVNADLGLSKTGPTTTIAGASAGFNYTLTVHNYGPAPSAGFSISDTLPSGTTYVDALSDVRCGPGLGQLVVCANTTGLAVGADDAFLVHVVVAASVAKDTILTNSATVTGSDLEPLAPAGGLHSNTATFDTTVDTRADVSVTKSDGVTAVLAGDGVTYTYTITVHNAGPSDAQAVSLSDTWPSGFTEGTITPSQGSCSLDGGTGPNFTCDLGVVTPTANATVTVTYTVPASTLGSKTNTVAVSSTTVDPNADPSNNTATDTNTVNTRADLSASKTDGVTTVVAGDGVTYTYTITVHNGGPSDAQAVSLSDTWPSGFAEGTITPSQGSCSLNGGTGPSFTCALGVVTPGVAGDVSIDVDYTVPSTTNSGVQTNSVTALTTTFDPAGSNNIGSDSTTVSEDVSLHITKTFADDSVIAGTTGHTFTIKVSNSGLSDADAVSVTDLVPGALIVTGVNAGTSGFDCSTSAGQQVTCTRAHLDPSDGEKTLTVTYRVASTTDTTSGVSNTAKVVSDEVLLGVTNADTVDITEDVVLTVTKLFDSAAVTAGGAARTFTVSVSNSGVSDADSLILTDTVDGRLLVDSVDVGDYSCPNPDSDAQTITCSLLHLAAGATKSITVHYHVDAATLNDPSVGNTAYAKSDEDDDNDHGTDDVAIATAADLSITKTDSVTPNPVYVNDTLTYTLTVRNDGPSDAQAVSVADTLPVRLSSVNITVSPGSPACETSETFPCALGTVASGATVVITVTGNVDPVSPVSSSMSNTATVTSTTPDPSPDVTPADGTPDNNVSTAATTVSLRTDSLVYGGGTLVQYSDSLSLSATLMDTTPTLPSGPIGIFGKTITFTITCTAANSVGDTVQTTTATTNGSGVASTTLRIYLKPQPLPNCSTVASFAGDTTYQAKTATSVGLTISKEEAAVSATDPSVIALTSTNKNGSGNLAQLVLKVTVDESADGASAKSLTPAGKPNLVGQQVSVTLTPVGAGSNYGPCIATLTAYDPVTSEYTASGFTGATCALFQNVQPNLYQVDATIVNSDYYTGTGIGVLLVYDPAAGMTTGGGWFTAADGSKVNFGFNAKFLKSGQAQGSFLAIWHKANGNYIVKSNAMGPSAITGPFGTTPNQYWIANLSGKATYQVPTGTLWCGLNKCGSFSWSVYVEDIKEPGAGFDHFWMKLQDPSNVTVSAVSMGTPITGTTGTQKTITGGNIQIPH